MRFKYYLFDLDNCLLHFINAKKYFNTIFAETIRNFTTIHPKKEEMQKAWNSPHLNQIIEHKWKINNIDDFWASFKKLDIKKRQLMIKKETIYLDQLGLDVITRLRQLGLKVALITNTPKYMFEILDSYFRFDNIFDGTLCVDYISDSSIAKPSPKGIDQLLRRLSYNEIEICKPNTILIGDSEIDIIAARKANICSCLIISKNKEKLEFQTWSIKPNYIINNFFELLDI
jgi:FMN phosphatase YigB (HAD superfamily)